MFQKKRKKESNMTTAAAVKLKDAIAYSGDSIVSKTFVEKKTGTVTLFAFDKGQGLSEHTAPFDAMVIVLEGRGVFTIGGEAQTLQEGQMLVMPAAIPHAVQASERFKMLLIMIRS